MTTGLKQAATEAIEEACLRHNNRPTLPETEGVFMEQYRPTFDENIVFLGHLGLNVVLGARLRHKIRAMQDSYGRGKVEQLHLQGLPEPILIREFLTRRETQGNGTVLFRRPRRCEISTTEELDNCMETAEFYFEAHAQAITGMRSWYKVVRRLLAQGIAGTVGEAEKMLGIRVQRPT